MTASCTTPSESSDTSVALTRAAQAAWEAPALRPTFTRDGDRETWAHQCPEWCTGDGEGHETDRIIRRAREHQGPSLCVRQDGGYGYESYDGEQVGVRSAHLELSLIAASRNLTPRIKISAHRGRFEDGRPIHQVINLAGLYPDEVRELITVLQHLLKVAEA